MANQDAENIELESQPLNTKQKHEILASNKSIHKEKVTPIGLTKEELMKYANDPFWCKLRKVLFVLFWFLWLCMFVGAFLIIRFVPNCPTTSKLKWYQREATGQIDLKLFDAKFNTLSKYEDSFMKIFQTKTFLLPNLYTNSVSNEIIDHYKLNSTYGSVDDLTKMIKQLKLIHGVNVIMDFNVPVTSFDHEWYKKFSNNEGKYSNYYLFQSSSDIKFYGYQTKSVSSDKYVITKNGMPYLNLLNPDVREEFRNIFETWAKRSIKGFRILGAPYLLSDPNTKTIEKSLTLNQMLIKDWSTDFKKYDSEGVLVLQLDDQDKKDSSRYFGTQENPIAAIVVNKYINEINMNVSPKTIVENLEKYINETKPWNDESSNIGPWTGWLIDDINENKSKDKLLICFGNILGYLLPRGMPISKISSNILDIGVSKAFLKVIEHEFNNIEFGTYDNARAFAKLTDLRKHFGDAILLGKTIFPEIKNDGSDASNDVFVMVRYNDKNAILVVSNLKQREINLKIELDFQKFSPSAEIVTSCEIKQGHLIGSTISLNEPISLRFNETFVAKLEMLQ